jgi:ATP phosphoribosyltransferase
VDLGIAKCRMSLCASQDLDVETMIRRGARLRVATKYLQTTRRYFADRGIHADLIKLYGSMELAPLVGLADVIVDLVSTGATLKANGLREVEVIGPVSSRLIVNQASLKLRYDQLEPLVQAFAQQTK